VIKDPFLGPIIPELGWVPAPRYLMRRARIKSLMSDVSTGHLLEIGPGAGTLLVEFADQGHHCEALEPSAEARKMIRAVVAKFGHPIPVHMECGDEWEGRFDVLCAFDVLEHIKDDQEALAQWVTWLRPGGVLMMSVPAHMRLWTTGDEWAGHYRRYGRNTLQKLLIDNGLEVTAFECYGFPLTNFSERLSAPIYRYRIKSQVCSADCGRKRNNDRSGIDRSPHLRIFPVLSSIPGKLVVRFFAAIQGVFIRTDLGTGYVVKARRQ
jgi:SAM-dependent methyltransferase